jgi:hypothetical protein
MSHIILSKDDCNFIKSFWDESSAIILNNSRKLVKLDLKVQ